MSLFNLLTQIYLIKLLTLKFYYLLSFPRKKKSIQVSVQFFFQFEQSENPNSPPKIGLSNSQRFGWRWGPVDGFIFKP